MTSERRDRFGALLRRRRLEAGLTQEELARRAGLSTRAISNLERGSTGQPYLRTVALLAGALGLGEAGRDELRAASHPGSDPEPVITLPRQLPGAVSAFTGRLRELDWLTRLAGGRRGAEGTMVISAIGGTAGVGKTALAVQWAHQAAGMFPDGQLFVNLRGYDPGQPMAPADALVSFLRALGVPGQDVPAGTEERAARYRSLLAGRRVLVVLDNAGSAEQVRPLLPGSTSCATIVTSRDSLAGLVARDGAHRLDLDMLPAADAAELLGKLIGDRAAADPAAIATLADRCGHLPLALRVAAELATARAGVPLTSLVAELADQQRRLDLLDAGGDPRTAVRAVFSWSCLRLDAASGRAFRLAGLHPGADFDGYAVAALTGLPMAETGQELRLLARAYLVQEAKGGRYGLHDLLRDYARELAGAQDGDGQTRAALTRLFDYYLYAAAEAMSTLFPAERHRRPQVEPPATPVPPLSSPAQARAWLDTERANLAAMAAQPGWPSHVLRLAMVLFRYLNGGFATEAQTMHGQALEAARETGDLGGEATALTNLAITDIWLARYQQASQRCQQALDKFRAIGDLAGEARALANLAGSEVWLGQLEPGTRHFRRSLALFRELGDQAGEARALASLGMSDLAGSDYRRGAGYFREALAVFRATGDRPGETSALSYLGLLECRQGHYREAAGYTRQALTLAQQTGDRYSEAQALITLSQAERAQGRYREAAGHLSKALALSRKIGDRSAQAVALTCLGVIDGDFGRHRRAAERHLTALAMFRAAGERNEVLALVNLGDSFLATGHTAQAHTHFAAALGVASRIGDSYYGARAQDGLGRASSALGDPGQARHHWEQALIQYAALRVPEADQVRARLAEPGVNGNGAETAVRS